MAARVAAVTNRKPELGGGVDAVAVIKRMPIRWRL
jgi:hypothetical protein